MRIYTDFSNFEPWSGAVDTWRIINEEGMLGQFENILDELFPDGMNETELNDLLWFEEDMILHDWLGLDTCGSVEKEIFELQNKLDELEEELDDARSEELDKDYINSLSEEISELKEEILDLKEKLEYL